MTAQTLPQIAAELNADIGRLQELVDEGMVPGADTAIDGAPAWTDDLQLDLCAAYGYWLAVQAAADEARLIATAAIEQAKQGSSE